MSMKSNAPQSNHATRLGTRRFAERFCLADRTHFRRARGMTISSIGIGTYQGNMSPAFDRKARAAIMCAVANGCNLIDTARSYRGGRSEIVVGDAVRGASTAGIARRDELIVCSKAGYILEQDESVGRFTADTIDGNVLNPIFLSSQVACSLEKTGLDVIDIYFLHNPEVHLSKLGSRRFYRLLASCFETMERYVADKKIGTYGLACWSAFDRKARSLIDISKVLHAAGLAGGSRYGNFGAVETPLNWLYRNAVVAPSRTSLLAACREAGLIVLGSSALLGGHFARLPTGMGKVIPGDLSDAQRSIQFARSIPGASAVLVRMNRTEHVKENLRLRQTPALRKSVMQRLCSVLERL
jgi:aryl-alcohol dehydrogenase-like predicted oxidoreductase